MELIHHGKFLKEGDHFVLGWSRPVITSVNGESVLGSRTLVETVKVLEKSMTYPTFQISSNGSFLKILDADKAWAKANEIAERVSNRTESNRQFYSDLEKSEFGNSMLNGIYKQIWQAWVEEWIDVCLTEGEFRTTSGNMVIYGSETPVTVTLTHKGLVKTNKNLVALQCELSFTNFVPAAKGLMEQISNAVTRTKAAELPLSTNVTVRCVTIVDVETEMRSLRPHWVRQMKIIETSTDQQQILRSQETREYSFKWRES